MNEKLQKKLKRYCFDKPDKFDDDGAYYLFQDDNKAVMITNGGDVIFKKYTYKIIQHAGIDAWYWESLTGHDDWCRMRDLISFLKK